MSKDFKASQIRTSKLVVSGTESGVPALLVYSASDATDFQGNYQSKMLDDLGPDVFLFVSGTRGSGESRDAVSVFGGDVVVSGTLYMENLVAEVDQTTPGDHYVSGALRVGGDVDIRGDRVYIGASDPGDSPTDVTIRSAQNRSSSLSFLEDLGAPDNLRTFGGPNVLGFRMVHAGDTNEFALERGGVGSVHNVLRVDRSTSKFFIMSGNMGGSRSPDEWTAVDTNFFVSGSKGSRSTGVRGTAVFGGDVVISGSLTDKDGNPIAGAGGGGDSVGWFSGSSASHTDLGLQPNWISTSGSLAVSGALHVASTINHINDPNTLIAFADDNFYVTAGGTTQLNVRTAAVDVNSSGGDIDFTAGIESGVVPNNPVGIKVDASTGQVLILSGGAKSSTVDEAVAQDVAFYVSGSKGSRGSVTRGSTLFGGDAVASGSLYGLRTVYAEDGLSGSYLETGLVKTVSPEGDLTVTSKGNIILDTEDHQSGVMFSYNGTDRLQLYGDAYGTVVLKHLTAGRSLSINEINGIQLARFEDGRGSIFNGVGNADHDFQVGSDNNFYALFVDAGKDQVLVLSGGSKISDNPSNYPDVNFFVSGTIGSKSTSDRGTSLFGGDVAISGSLYGTQKIGIENFRELSVVSDRVSFGNGTNKNIGNEVFFYVSGTSPITSDSNPTFALFDGNLVSSGNVSIIQAYPQTGSQLLVSNLTDTALWGGSAQFDMRAGADGGRDTQFSIQKYGPNNIEASGGPYANILQARSGAMVFMVGNPEDSSALGSQPFIIRDLSGGTFFMSTTGSVMGGDNQVYFMSGGAATSNRLSAGDTNFIVSGSIGSSGKIGPTRGTSLFGGDLVVSGALKAVNGANAGGSISGSIHHTSEGKSYLIAGDNVTIVSGTDGSVTISAASGGGGGSVDTVSGSTSVSSITSIDFSRLGLLMDLGSNKIALTGTIGPSEDGTYTDGLFTTFNANTEIGHAIDKINEVLYYLAPTPAPDLSRIANDGLTGEPVRLSFGAATGLPSPNTFNYVAVAGTAGFGAAVDVNEQYQVATSSNNIRMGVFGPSKSVIRGDIANNVSANSYVNGVINHSGSVFGDADQGTLSLEVNGSAIVSLDLTDDATGTGSPGSGTGTHVDGNGTGFIQLSTTASAYQSNGQSFGLFNNRSGRFQVGTATQRNGWNYAQVKHTVGTSTKSTNYVEWFNDGGGTAPNTNKTRIENVVLSGSKWISGILYATGAEGDYINRIDNFYDFTYAQNNIQFATTNTDAIAQQQVPALPESSNAHLESIDLTGSFQILESSINAGTMASGSATFNISVTHPIKANISASGSLTSKEFLIYSASQNASTLFEDFVYEDYRLKSGSYNAQSDIGSAGNVWDSTLHITSSVTGQGDGLVFYTGKLKSATATTTQGGNFTIFDPSFIQSAPGHHQPNYSTGGATSGTKTFFRSFKNTSGAAARDFKVCITGSNTTLVPITTGLDSGKIRVFFKLPENTGWLDLGQAFNSTLGQFLVTDYSGGYLGNSLNTSIASDNPVTNYGTFGTASVGNNDSIAFKIEADSDWAGHLEGFNVVFPATTNSEVSTAPQLDETQIDAPGTFYSGKLSFGAGKSLSLGEQQVTGSSASNSGISFGVGTNVNFNESYASSTSQGANKRYGIISSNGGAQTIKGALNGDVTANGNHANNFTADSFGNAHSGTLTLWVNQSGSGVNPVHYLDLATFQGQGNPGAGTATSKNANGSGFISASIAQPGKNSSSLADYRKWYRTMHFEVAPGDQNPLGWNWAKITHTLDDTVINTTFVEWVNDSDGDAIDIPSEESGSFHASSYYMQSGVKYFNTALSPVATGTVKYRVSDAYTNVYSNSSTAVRLTTLTGLTAQGIFITGSGVTDSGDTSLTSNGTTLPALQAGGAVDADIHVTGTLTYTGGTSLPLDSSISDTGGGSTSFTSQNARATLTVDHPIDTNAVQAVTFQKFLAYSGSAGSSNPHTAEKFTGEYFRMQSGSYDNQAASGSLRWKSSESLVGADAGHNTGLLIYGLNSDSKGYLVSPKYSALPNGGDFRNFADLNAPPDNVNYSAASGERSFVRTFKNNTSSDQAVISITVKGDATLVPEYGAGSASLGANKNVHIFVKIPGKTGWLDIARAADGTITDGGGALQGDRDATIDLAGATNEVTFSTAFVGGDPSSNGSGEHFCLAIHADSSWTGHITEISVTF